MLYLCVLVIFVFFAGVAMSVNEGLWSNTISFMSIVLSSVLGMALGPPLGLMLQDKLEKGPELTWYFTFAGVWLVFFAAIMVVRIVAERLSRVRMKFVPPLERVAGPLMALAVSVVFTSFLAFTLYTMPIRAGHWDFDAASGWQKSTIQSGAGPFYKILESALGEDRANAAISQ